MTSVSLTGTNHAEDQPVHLRVVKTPEFMREVDEGNQGMNVDRAKERRREHVQVNVDEYAGLLGRACPAGVYEYVEAEVSSDVHLFNLLTWGWNRRSETNARAKKGGEARS